MLFKRFLDDIFAIFEGTTKELHELFEAINQIHPTLKFTMQHTSIESEPETDKCKCETRTSIPFLDTSCSIEEGKIEIDLYRKETDRNQYLLTSSCHPIGCTKNIPYSLGLRIVRTCTNPIIRDKRLYELKSLLSSRDYPVRLIDSALAKARAVPREKALRRVIRKKQSDKKRPIFAVRFDPRLPSITNMQAKHWRSMTNDQYMAEVFPQPPLTAFRRQKNLKDLLIRAKVPGDRRPLRFQNGMTKCGRPCTACPYIRPNKKVRIKENLYWTINRKVDCQSFNVIYLLECDKESCQKKYIGETGRIFKFRLDEHRGYINTKDESQPIGAHFNLPGHSLANLKATIIEVLVNIELYRKERESLYIRKFNTYHDGMYKQK